jgi:hypothetical protein
MPPWLTTANVPAGWRRRSSFRFQIRCRAEVRAGRAPAAARPPRRPQAAAKNDEAALWRASHRKRDLLDRIDALAHLVAQQRGDAALSGRNVTADDDHPALARACSQLIRRMAPALPAEPSGRNRIS